MALNTPRCHSPNCRVSLQSRPAMARRGGRTVSYAAQVWRCDRCADPDTGSPPLEFMDAQLIGANESALAAEWRAKYGEEIPPSGRPGRPTDAPKTERVAVLLTREELERLDARRGARSRSEFLREVVANTLRDAS
jgi:hypothetical protein